MTVVQEPSTTDAKLSFAEPMRPTRRSVALFRAKVLVHQVTHGCRDLISAPRTLPQIDDPSYSQIVAESRTALWSDERLAERALQMGKVQNLRRAVRQLDRVIIPAAQVFSFWKQIGRPTRRRGFVVGRMLQEGCLIPAVGGGLCQLSNALYDAALKAGCEIVERHAHSRAVPGSATVVGRDATVAWNYVDLRFKPGRPLQIAARIERDALVVRFVAKPGDNLAPTEPSRVATPHPSVTARSCATCGETACFRHELHPHIVEGRTAYLVDENWPEFRDYVASVHGPNDVFGLPFDGARWHVSRYRWDTAGFAQVGSAPIQALLRALGMRQLPAQGAARREFELFAAARIAARLSRLLTADVTQICVAQSFLPFLWRAGHLGGRELSVLMTRLPMGELQRELDAAAAVHPERATLSDFRAPTWLIAAEAEALAYTDHIVTPHAGVARLFAGKSIMVDWLRPAASGQAGKARPDRVAFPGPTIARAGAYEVRAAARTLGLEVVRIGSELEGQDFWNGVRIHRPSPHSESGAGLDGVAAVVQPAIVAGRPRHLLAALAAGCPVIATAACGLPEQPGLTLIPANDAEALINALRRVLA
jgi:hypothetical protein